MQNIITENNPIKLTHYDETIRGAHDWLSVACGQDWNFFVSSQ